MRYTYIPNDEGVVVLAAKRGEKLLIVGEGKALDQYLVELKSLDRLEGVEVPNDDIGL
jgi:hypothetical protein